MSDHSPFNPELVARAREMPLLADLAYEGIAEAIRTGRIQPGERLRQETLARQLEMSPRPVREALAKLVAEGRAVHDPRKGVRVVTIPAEEFVEIYRMRAPGRVCDGGGGGGGKHSLAPSRCGLDIRPVEV